VADEVRIERRSVTEQATNIIRELILNGELRPGQPVTHQDMSRRLGVSTMPVREALIRLTHEGFIDARQGRVFRVAQTSRQDVDDIYWLHGLLSGELAARACKRGDSELVRRLREINSGWEHLPNADLTDREFAFHTAIQRAAESPKLAKMIEHTTRFMPRAFFELMPTRRADARTEHALIIDAIVAGDAERARLAAEHHAHTAGDLMIRHFESSGLWPPDPD
jgi:DNA-binding GntR family transcriptional regulator